MWTQQSPWSRGYVKRTLSDGSFTQVLLPEKSLALLFRYFFEKGSDQLDLPSQLEPVAMDSLDGGQRSDWGVRILR